jgi:hypothetical protein
VSGGMSEDYKGDTNQETRKSGKGCWQIDADWFGIFLSWLSGFQINSL